MNKINKGLFAGALGLCALAMMGSSYGYELKLNMVSECKDAYATVNGKVQQYACKNGIINISNITKDAEVAVHVSQSDKSQKTFKFIFRTDYTEYLNHKDFCPFIFKAKDNHCQTTNSLCLGKTVEISSNFNPSSNADFAVKMYCVKKEGCENTVWTDSIGFTNEKNASKCAEVIPKKHVNKH